MAGQRTLGLNAIRSNPNLVGYSLTGTMDHVNCGEGLFTLFRELKHGTVDALIDGLAPLRLCLFVEPVHIYNGTSVHLEVVLANEDALRPGEYPLRMQIFGPNTTHVFEDVITVKIPEQNIKEELAFALQIFSKSVIINGPTGKYRFLASFDRGAVATGGETEFYVSNEAEMPNIEKIEVVQWGEDLYLSNWLSKHGIHTKQFSPNATATREVILISNKPFAQGGADEFRELVRRIASGATAIFLSPAVLAKGDQPLGWLPLVNKGTLSKIRGWLYLKDEWIKYHPIFDGLPSGGLMDYTFYREIIPDDVWSGQDAPSEAVAGAIKASQDYSSGLIIAIYNLGAGRFFLNTLLIRENLGIHPVAERLLRNMIRYAARDINRPLADLPIDFNQQLKEMDY
jgi:hypothetical protein